MNGWMGGWVGDRRVNDNGNGDEGIEELVC